ncbi:MAG: ATP-binding protein [Cytophagales bacterium]|nr:ATP-binding protein [Cytophagales bacterium]
MKLLLHLLIVSSIKQVKEKEYIKRSIYFEKIRPLIHQQLIKVFVGQRRVGKSNLLYQAIDEIKRLTPGKKILFVDKEDYQYDHIRDYHDLMAFVKREIKDDAEAALFIDEIQEIDQFQKALRSLLSEGRFDIYCTGSNAKLLSGELATVLTGRYIEIPVHPLSYLEYLTFHRLENTKEALQKYLVQGGMPYLIHLPGEEEVVMQYLKTVFNTILYKDIVSRFNIRNTNFLEALVKFIGDNLGSLLSAKKISDFLKSQRINISVQVVIDYLSHLEAAQVVRKVQRAEVGGKKIFEIGEKHYFEDVGIRNAIVGHRVDHIHKILENVVYNHMVISGYEVFVGKHDQREIDFMCKKGAEIKYIQVAYILAEQATIDREFGNLLRIKDNHPKFVISMDDVLPQTNRDGIIHTHLQTFLSEYQ